MPVSEPTQVKVCINYNPPKYVVHHFANKYAVDDKGNMTVSMGNVQVATYADCQWCYAVVENNEEDSNA